MAWPPTTHQDVQDAVTGLLAATGGTLTGLTTGTSAAAANTALIQAAINTAGTASGGAVIIPTGTWYVNPLVMRSRVRLIGTSWGSQLILAAGTNTHMITLYDIQTGQTSIENLWLNGNKANQTSGDVIHYDNTGFSQSLSFPDLGDPNHTMHRVLIQDAKNDGLHVIGGLGQGQFEKVLAYHCDGHGFNIAAPDNQFISCIAAVSGLDNFYIAANSVHLVNPKSWLAGNVDATQGSGYVIASVGRVTLVGAEAQDNRLHGYSLISAYDCLLDVTADRNGLGPEPVTGGAGSGLSISYSTRNQIRLVSGDRDTANPTHQYAYNAGTSNDGNIVDITSGITKSGTIGTGSFGSNSLLRAIYNGTITSGGSSSGPGAGTPFTDDFTTLDTTTKWPSSYGVSVSSGQLVVPCTSSYPSLISGYDFNLATTSVWIGLLSLPAAGNGGTQTSFYVSDGTNTLGFQVGGGTTRNLSLIVDTVSTTSVTYDATNHKYLRIRTSGANVLLDGSPDDSTWTNIRTATTPSWATAALLKVQVSSGYYGTETAPGNAVFDNFRL